MKIGKTATKREYTRGRQKAASVLENVTPYVVKLEICQLRHGRLQQFYRTCHAPYFVCFVHEISLIIVRMTSASWTTSTVVFDFIKSVFLGSTYCYQLLQ